MKKFYIYGMAAVLGLGLPMASCSDDDAITKEDITEIINENSLTADQIKALIDENTLTEEQIKQLIEENSLSQDEIEEIVKEYNKMTIDKEYHTVGIDTLETYILNFNGGNTAYIKVEGATDENIRDVFQLFYDCEVKGFLDLTDCKLENITSTIQGYHYKISGLVFPKGLKSIPECFAQYNSNIESVTFQEGIERIPDYAFDEGGSITSLTLPEGLKSIGTDAFDTNPLESLTLPSTLESIEGEYAFYDNNITTLVIPASVKTIGSYSFEGSYNLESVTFLGTSTEGLKICADAFDNCSSDMKIYVQNEEFGKYLVGINSSWEVYCGDKQLSEDEDEDEDEDGDGE